MKKRHHVAPADNQQFSGIFVCYLAAKIPTLEINNDHIMYAMETDGRTDRQTGVTPSMLNASS